VTAFENTAIFLLSPDNLLLKPLQFCDVFKNFNASCNSAFRVAKSGGGAYDGDLLAFNIFYHVLPVVDVAPICYSSLQGTVRFADGILEHILAVHAYGIVGRETRNLLRRRIKKGNAIFLVCGEKPIRNSVQDLNKALFLMINLFKGLEIVFMYLFREEMIPAPSMFSSLVFEIGTDKTCREFLKEVLFKEIGAMGLGNEPAFLALFPMSGAEHLRAGQKLPAGLPVAVIPLIKGCDEVPV